MKSEAPLDYAVFQLSPRRSRCELFVSYDGTTEKLASGLVKPFVTHLKVAEEQVASAVKSIKLEVDRHNNEETWFTKGTLERFVRFVSTPEILELVNTFDAEMAQLEAARRIYSQGTEDQHSSGSGGDGTGAIAASDATKKELLRAIDVRLTAVRQDLTAACTRASAAGFNPKTVAELQLFAERFGAHRLSDACSKFISLSHRRLNLFSTWKSGVDDRAIRFSSESDMSLDDPSESDAQPGTCPAQPQKSDHANPNSTNNKQSSIKFPLQSFSREPSVERENDTKEGNHRREEDGSKNGEDATLADSPSSILTGPPARRLSVQDRINLFESKQKENSSSTGKPVVVAKPAAELRRLSSDVSSSGGFEKAVLRRWSGASDMSIDVSCERKEPDSNATTPTPTSASLLHAKPSSSSPEEKGWKETSGDMVRPEIKDQPEVKKDEVEAKPIKAKFVARVTAISRGSEENSYSESMGSPISSGSENVGGWDQSSAGTHSRTTPSHVEESGLENQATSNTQFGSWPGKAEFISKGQTGSEEKVKAEEEFKSRADAGKKFGFSTAASRFGDGRSERTQEEHEDDEVRDQLDPRSQFTASHKRTVDGASEFAASEFCSKPVSLQGDVDELRGRDPEPFERQQEKFSAEVEDSGSLKMKFQRQGAGEQGNRSRGRRVVGGSVPGKSQQCLPRNTASEDQETLSSASMASLEQVQRMRLLKGNQELNDELKMKASELEKLFAEHKLRVPVDQSSSLLRGKPIEMQKEQEASPFYRKPAVPISPSSMAMKKTVSEFDGTSTNVDKINSTPLTKAPNVQDNDVTPRQNIYSLSFSDESRGNFYDRYMQKRNAKLKEEWSSKRGEKEARMKAMEDSLERNRAEMKAKLTGSADRKDSVFDAGRRAEKLGSFNVRSAMKRDQLSEYLTSDDCEDQAEYLGKKLSETFLRDAPSSSSQNRKGLPTKNMSSTTPRMLAAQIPRSAVKASNSSTGRRKLQSENLLAQSVPNFSDFKQENTKPSGGSKAARPQVRSYARNKSSSEEVVLVKEEKPCRSRSLKKISGNPVDLNESLDDREEAEFNSKTFQRKGNGVASVAVSSIVRLKSSIMAEAARNEEESDDLSFEPEELMDVGKGEEEGNFETMVGEDPGNMDNGKARLSQEFDKSANSGYDNSEALGSLAQTESVSASIAALPSAFRTMDSVQDSPGESPGSWNSRLQNPFSFSHEIPDFDADSPIGSPGSWNFHSLAQGDADAARMRKKWGTAQKPFVVSDTSHSHSRKDVTRGLKRFLKFGRKNRGAESLADWISATTSEGDDDTEDGRDLANRSSEDLRKSRMGFSHGHDVFNEGDTLNEHAHALQSSIPAPPSNFKLRDDHLSGSSLKAPKSFFSLSTFRSKGNESKPR